MAALRTPEPLTSDDDETLQSSPLDDHSPDQPEAHSHPSPPSAYPQSSQPPKASLPMQKRRRVTRACDECRRKKIKCDGKQPCTHCTVYSYECTYDQPSNRRRNPAPAYIEALEMRLQKAEAILRILLPGADLEDTRFDAYDIEQLTDPSRRARPSGKASTVGVKSPAAQDDDAQLQTMVEGTGLLDLDDQGHWDYHGNSSGFTFMQNLCAQFGDFSMPDPRIPNSKLRPVTQFIESPKSASSSPHDFSNPPTADLSERETVMRLCRNTLEVACALLRFVHKPKFYAKVSRIVDTDPDHYTNDDTHFLPLLYVVMAVGCLFGQTKDSWLDTQGYESATEQGVRYLEAAQNMLDITDCRDLTTLQAVVFMILFLQSTAKLATCYSYVGLALRSCCRLGLHRNIKNAFDPIEQEERKRIFWLLRKMDVYVGALLGLPQMLSGEDADQELPLEVEDEFITANGILLMPPGTFSLMRATNAHARLVDVLQKVVKLIYPVKAFESAKPGEPYSISHSKIREIETDLQGWMDDLPMELRPSDNPPSELARVQQLLRLAYAHVQMMLYRPFLHYVAQGIDAAKVNKRSYACAAACVSVARNIVHITAEMNRRGLLIGSHWFVMYTSYFSILSLVFFVLENPRSRTGKEIMRDAIEGRDVLLSLAKRSLAADRCSHSLKALFAKLPVKLNERKSLSRSGTVSRKRPNEGPELETGEGFQSTPVVAPHSEHDAHVTSGRSGSSFPHQDMVASGGRPRAGPSPCSARSPFGDSPPMASERWTSQDPSMVADPQPAGPAPLLGEGGLSQQMPCSSQPVCDGLPDLGDLMYPSMNPFAYGNQPLSILEDAQVVVVPEQQGSLAVRPGGFGAAAHNTGPAPPASMAMDGFNNLTCQNHATPAVYLGERYDMTTMCGKGHAAASLANLPSINFPEVGGLGVDEGVWQQVDKSRTGMTPRVDLDELFGRNGGGWNPVYTEQGFAQTQ